MRLGLNDININEIKNASMIEGLTALVSSGLSLVWLELVMFALACAVYVLFTGGSAGVGQGRLLWCYRARSASEP